MPLAVTTAGWRIEPQKTRGKTANRAVRISQRNFSVNSAQIMPSQRIFSVKVSVTAYSSHRKYPPTVVFPQIGGCFTFSVQKYVLRIKDSPHPQSHLSMT